MKPLYSKTNKQVMKLIAIKFVTLLLIVTSKTQACSPIQRCDVMTDDICYVHMDVNLNWIQAEECCVAWGGQLASIHSNDTNILLNNLCNQLQVSFAWIGLTTKNGDYVWTDGTRFDYDNLIKIYNPFLTEKPVSISHKDLSRGMTLIAIIKYSHLSVKKNTRVDDSTTRRNENAVSRILMKVQNLTIFGRFTSFNDELNADIIGLHVNSSKQIKIPFDNVEVGINPRSFLENPTVFSAVYRDKSNFTSSERIWGKVITIASSEELYGSLTIEFNFKNQKIESRLFFCHFLSNGVWSTTGITTRIGKCSVVCVTEVLGTIALLSSGDTLHYKVATYVLMSVSLLFLLASIIAFLVSWRKVFRIDIHVMNFNHGIALFLATFVSIFGMEVSSVDPAVCHVVEFFMFFFWTNVFLSSLSISALIFYTIWIVGIRHPAKKLSPYLIPISLSISAIWALIWLVIELADDDDCNSRASSCIFSHNMAFAFYIPMQVIVVINILMLFLILLKIRRVFKNSNRKERELVRLMKVAFGGFLLVPSLGFPFIFSIPLSFPDKYIDNIDLYRSIRWMYLICTATIGIQHFFLVTCRTPEVKLPNCNCCNRRKQTSNSNTSLPSSSQIFQTPLNLNVVRTKPKFDVVIVENDNTES